jgi:dolichol-phosphate mannosyltransferase
MRIAVVIPAYNEAGNIGWLIEETFAAVPEASLQGAGQSVALRSGVIAASAPVIATMDGDGQNDPADIMRLVSRLGRKGGEPALVGGLREGRKAKGSRKAASRFANWIRDKVLADGCPDTGCGLKVYRRDYLNLPYFTSMLPLVHPAQPTPSPIPIASMTTEVPALPFRGFSLKADEKR